MRVSRVDLPIKEAHLRFYRLGISVKLVIPRCFGAVAEVSTLFQYNLSCLRREVLLKRVGAVLEI